MCVNFVVDGKEMIYICKALPIYDNKRQWHAHCEEIHRNVDTYFFFDTKREDLTILFEQLKAHLYYSSLSSLFLLFWSTWDITKEIVESSFSLGKEGDWQRSTHSGESFTVECLDSWLAQCSFTAVKWPATEQAIRSKG